MGKFLEPGLNGMLAFHSMYRSIHLSIDPCSDVSSCVTVPLAGLAYKQLFQQFNVDKNTFKVAFTDA